MAVHASKLDLDEQRRLQRQAEWRARNAAVLKKLRTRRLERLRARKPEIDRATAAYAKIDKGEVPSIIFRPEFIRLHPPRALLAEGDTGGESAVSQSERQELIKADVESRPLLTRMIYRKTNALQFYMAAVYVAHVEGVPGANFNNRHRNVFGVEGRDSWAMLAGLASAANVRARRVRVTRALDELSELDLVDLGAAGSRDRYEYFGLCRDDGSHRRYSAPGSKSKGVSLPAAFFLNGWHLVLEPKEVATLLAILEMAAGVTGAEASGGVALPDKVRWERYGLSGEAYESIHELEEFGLISIRDTMVNRRRGKIRPPTDEQREEARAAETSFEPVPYRFIPHDVEKAFARNARKAVSACLKNFELPLRLSF